MSFVRISWSLLFLFPCFQIAASSSCFPADPLWPPLTHAWGWKDENACMDEWDAGVIARGRIPPRSDKRRVLPPLIKIAGDASGSRIDGDQICAHVGFLSSVLQGGSYRLAVEFSARYVLHAVEWFCTAAVDQAWPERRKEAARPWRPALELDQPWRSERCFDRIQIHQEQKVYFVQRSDINTLKLK